jgi:methoxymalonate biosynthesis acyl carrier protein
MTTARQQSTDEAIGRQISGFLQERTRKAWEPDVDLFADGSVSSLFATELVVFLEEAFDIEIAGRDLRLDNFRTILSMTELVRRLQAEDGDD